MGKTNKGQRTKGNTRPSSSVQSAQLLNSCGKTFSGFVGFEALEKETTPCYVPVTGQPEDTNIDSDFRMVMRKMFKRDALTRLKAVQEFGDYCITKDVETVKSVLPFWPRLFNKLALDCDRRIREATHHTNGKLLEKVHREFAPYLRNVISVWLLGQCDSYAPSASAAQAAFEATFPPAKRSQVLIFCKSEIFSYFKENLYDSSKTASSANSSSSEDDENKQTLILTSTLLALKFVISNVLPEEISSLENDFYDIISEAKFWNYLKHKDAQVRNSWYAFLSVLCSSKIGILPKIEKRLSSVVVSCLSEKDPATCTVAWDAALHIVFHLKTCWDGVDVQRKVFPQLWSFLQEGGRGNANTLYPCLLPLISKFPYEILESANFQLQFISYLHDSLSLESVKMSRTECDAIVQAYFECFQYFCCNFKENGTILMENVLIQQITQLVECSIFVKEFFHLSSSKFYPSLRSLLNKIEQLSEKSGNNSNAFFDASTLFWDKLFCITCKFYTRKKTEMDSLVLHLTHFFNGIFNPLYSKVESARVRFNDGNLEKNEDSELPISSCHFPATPFKKDSPSLKYVLKLSNFLSYKLSKNFDIHSFKLLKELFKLTLNKQHLDELLRLVCNTEENAALEFIEDKILKWVTNENEIGFDDMVDIVFCICCCISDEEGLKVLNSCCEVENVRFFHKLLNRGRLYVEKTPFKSWLKETEWMDIIMKQLKILICVSPDSNKVSNEYLTHFKSLLIFCFSDPVLKEVLAVKKKHEDFFSLCQEFFNQNPKSVLPECSEMLSLICQMMHILLENFTICWKDSAADFILTHLFKSTLLSETHFGDELYTATLSLWNMAVKNNVKYHERSSFILKTASGLHSAISSLLNETQVEFISRLAENLLHCLNYEAQSHCDLYLNIKCEMLEIILPSESEWTALQNELHVSLVPSLIENLIFYPLPNNQSNPLQNDAIKKLILITKLVCIILSKVIDSSEINNELIEPILLKHIPFLMWVQNFCIGNGYINQTLLNTLKSENLISISTKLLLSFPIQHIGKVLKAIFHQSCIIGSSWISTLETSLLLIVEKFHHELEFIILELLSSVDTIDGPSHSTVQVLLHHIPFDKKCEILACLHEEFNIALKQSEQIDEKCLCILAKICCILQDKKFIRDNKAHNIGRDLLISVAKTTEEENILLNLQATSILSYLNKFGIAHFISEDIWTFFINILKSCFQKTRTVNYEEDSSLLLVHQVTSLAHILFVYVDNIPPAPITLFPPEWCPTIDKQLHKDFVLFFIHLSESGVQYSHMFKTFEKTMSTMCDALESISGPLLVDMFLMSDTTINGKEMLQCLISALSSNVLHIQYGAHRILLKVLALLPANLLSTIEDDDEQDFKIPARLSPLLDLAHFSNEIIENMLSDIKIGDCCIVVPHTDSYRFSMSYLFVWLEILEFISSSQTQLRASYVEDLEEKNLLPALFSNVFCLMPENPAEFAQSNDIPSTSDSLMPLFLHHPKILKGSTPEQIQHFACHVFATALCKIPASIRTWFNNLDKRSSEVVNKFTSKFISNILITQEIQTVHENETQFENMTVHARPGSREVSAVYTVDDCPIELCIKLPVNFPLGQVLTERRGKVVVAQQEWRHWHMQLTTVLTYQNGSILDGLTIWKRNLDKKFENIEECMICYYILHNSTLKLPKLSCHVCRKRFHSDCLYKWFRTSNNFTCPLCRNEFVI